LHRTEVDCLERCDRVLAEDGVDVDIDGDGLVNVLALALEDIEDDVRCLGAGL